METYLLQGLSVFFLSLWKTYLGPALSAPYGFYGVMALTPILVGIPLGVWISARLGTHKPKIIITLLACSVFWSSVLYFAAGYGITFI